MLAKESGGKVHAVSRSGASGPLQFMYATGSRFGLGTVDGFDQRFDPVGAVCEIERNVGFERADEIASGLDDRAIEFNDGPFDAKLAKVNREAAEIRVEPDADETVRPLSGDIHPLRKCLRRYGNRHVRPSQFRR